MSGPVHKVPPNPSRRLSATGDLPTFTNEVIIIRPKQFYENVLAQADNKFMKNSGLSRDDTNKQVNSNITNVFSCRRSKSLTTSKVH